MLRGSKNWFNEFFAKDTSRKIRAVQKAKGEQGIPLTTNVPFGYRKDPEDRTKWVVDEAAALVVKRIFKLCMEGRGPMQIAKLLQAEQVLNPTAYKRREGINTPSPETADPYHWNPNTVVHILERREYTGCTVNFKTYTNSIWDKKQRETPIEKQAVFYNTHPAIIEQEVFDKVQEIRKQRHRRTKPERAVYSPAWFTVLTAGQKCATAPPTTLRSGKTILYAPATAATREPVQPISFGRLYWKNWSGCT